MLTRTGPVVAEAVGVDVRVGVEVGVFVIVVVGVIVGVAVCGQTPRHGVGVAVGVGVDVTVGESVGVAVATGSMLTIPSNVAATGMGKDAGLSSLTLWIPTTPIPSCTGKSERFSRRPFPYTPGRSAPSVTQVSLAELVLTSGAVQFTERPELPRKGPLVIET
jgi:hypothetical protein